MRNVNNQIIIGNVTWDMADVGSLNVRLEDVMVAAK
jgi:hypothetical protein